MFNYFNYYYYFIAVLTLSLTGQNILDVVTGRYGDGGIKKPPSLVLIIFIQIFNILF